MSTKMMKVTCMKSVFIMLEDGTEQEIEKGQKVRLAMHPNARGVYKGKYRVANTANMTIGHATSEQASLIIGFDLAKANLLC